MDSSFARLNGALLTQLLSGLFRYVSDRRKQRTKALNLYRGKRIEIGTNLFYERGTDGNIQKNIAYWRIRSITAKFPHKIFFCYEISILLHIRSCVFECF